METLSSRYAMALRESASWYGAVTIDELAGRVCDALLVLIPADGVGWNEICMPDGALRVLARPQDYFPSRHERLAELASHEPVSPGSRADDRALRARPGVDHDQRAGPAIKADIDAGKLSPLGLIRVKSANPGELGQNHQVLACGYDLNGTSLALHVHDPNRRRRLGSSLPRHRRSGSHDGRHLHGRLGAGVLLLQDAVRVGRIHPRSSAPSTERSRYSSAP